MNHDPVPGRLGPVITPKIGDDPDGGQVIGPHGESPEDPVAKGLYRGCMITILIIGITLAIAMLVYRMVTNTAPPAAEPLAAVQELSEPAANERPPRRIWTVGARGTAPTPGGQAA